MICRTHSRIALAVSLAIAGASAQAANPEFQNFFFLVCPGATGALAARCAETPGGLGNLSGDSESSLNPSQSLSRNQPAVGTALTRTKAARERGERGREPAFQEKVEAADGRWSLLVNVHATETDRDSDGATTAERGFTADSRALEVGFDYRLNERSVLGALAGFERAESEFDAEGSGVNFTPQALAGDSESDNQYLTLFGSFALGARGFVELSAGMERSDGSYRRFSVFQESTRTRAQTNVGVEGDADGTVYWVSANAGLDLARDKASFGPYVGISSVQAKLDGYTERDLNGSGLAMRFSSTSRRSLVAHAGVRASYTVSGAAGVLLPQVRVEYQKDFADDPETVSASFAQDARNTQYLMTGRNWDRSGINAGLSLTAILPNGWMPYLDYAVVLGYSNLDRQRATLGLRVEF